MLQLEKSLVLSAMATQMKAMKLKSGLLLSSAGQKERVAVQHYIKKLGHKSQEMRDRAEEARTFNKKVTQTLLTEIQHLEKTIRHMFPINIVRHIVHSGLASEDTSITLKTKMQEAKGFSLRSPLLSAVPPALSPRHRNQPSLEPMALSSPTGGSEATVMLGAYKGSLGVPRGILGSRSSASTKTKQSSSFIADSSAVGFPVDTGGRVDTESYSVSNDPTTLASRPLTGAQVRVGVEVGVGVGCA